MSRIDNCEIQRNQEKSYLTEKVTNTENIIKSGLERITSLDFIIVMSDIALGKPAKQSSTLDIYIANYAVDGNRGTDIIENRCSHTGGGDLNPWWMVDLQAVYYIKTVRIFNRGMDQLGIDVSHWLQNVTVTVGVTESNVNTLCGFFPGPGTLAQLVVIDCPTSTKGKFVRISKPTEALTLCEVEVFGDLL